MTQELPKDVQEEKLPADVEQMLDALVDIVLKAGRRDGARGVTSAWPEEYQTTRDALTSLLASRLQDEERPFLDMVLMESKQCSPQQESDLEEENRLADAVRSWQSDESAHPLTCGFNSDHKPLRPIIGVNGVFLECPNYGCDYTQHLSGTQLGLLVLARFNTIPE